MEILVHQLIDPFPGDVYLHRLVDLVPFVHLPQSPGLVDQGGDELRSQSRQDAEEECPLRLLRRRPVIRQVVPEAIYPDCLWPSLPNTDLRPHWDDEVADLPIHEHRLVIFQDGLEVLQRATIPPRQVHLQIPAHDPVEVVLVPTSKIYQLLAAWYLPVFRVDLQHLLLGHSGVFVVLHL